MGSGVISVTLYGTPNYAPVLLLYWVAFCLAGLASGRSLMGPVALLCALGLAILQSLDPELALKQAMWLAVGCVFYRTLRTRGGAALIHRWGEWLVLCSVVALAVTTVFGTEVGGARSWLRLGSISFQPVEWVKVALVLYWASFFARYESKQGQALTRRIVLTLVVILLLAIQRDLGPVMVLGLTAVLWCLVTHVPYRKLLGPSLGLAALTFLTVSVLPHVEARIQAWLHPWNDPFGLGYQTLQTRLAMAQGGLFGRGWFNGDTFIPAAATDLPLVAVTERVGAMGAIGILCVVVLLVRRMITASNCMRDPYRRQAGLGMTMLFIAQSLIVTAGSTGLSPMVGLTFPFLSYGGNALLAAWVQLALVGHTEKQVSADSEGFLLLPRRLLPVITAPIVAALGLLLFWTVIEGPQLRAHPLFAGQRRLGQASQREGITARGGEVFTLTSAQGVRRSQAESLHHVIGYVDTRFGVAGLEATFDTWLAGQQTKGSQRLASSFDQPWQVHTTIDTKLQNVVADALGSQHGAIVVIDPWTGAILATTSSPRFDPDDLALAMGASRSDAPLLNRAFQGLYSPGSTFKLVVLAAALESGAATSSDRWIDPGIMLFDGYRVQNPGAKPYGTLTAQQALARSSNVVFAQLAVRSGQAAIRLQAQAFGIGQPQSLEVPYSRGQLGTLDTMVQLAAAGLGQGEVLVTPVEMAVVAASIANGGYRVWPHLVTHLTADRERMDMAVQAPVRAISPATAQSLADGMRLATQDGTAAGSGNMGQLAGKTGTAENPHGSPHAWFVGFAPAHNPVVAFAIVVENAGSGARIAVPIASKIAMTLSKETPGR